VNHISTNMNVTNVYQNERVRDILGMSSKWMRESSRKRKPAMVMKQTPHTPRSRRERPAKPALTRQGIVDAALTILRDEGLDKVTMRRIAAVLDTGAASLYVYVRDTEDLHAQILDALLESIREEKPTGGTWQEQLKTLLTRYAIVLFEYPEIARMAMSTQPSGPHYMSLLDRILALLNEGGVADREAAWGVDLLLLFATATAVEHGTARPSGQTAAEESARSIKAAASDADQYPYIARLGEELFSGPGTDRFTWGVDVLLAGILTTRRTSPHNETPANK